MINAHGKLPTRVGAQIDWGGLRSKGNGDKNIYWWEHIQKIKKAQIKKLNEIKEKLFIIGYVLRTYEYLHIGIMAILDLH